VGAGFQQTIPMHETIALIRAHTSALPTLAKFAAIMAIIVGIPPLSRRVRLPDIVGLLLSGVLIGPYILDIAGEHRPVVEFAAELGKLLLMFFCGLEINLTLFRQVQRRSITFGLVTTLTPLLLGTAVGFWFGYGPIASVVLGSLLASHTLLAAPIVTRLGLTGLEPITVTIGATVLSDTLSLIVFAICVSTYKSGFSLQGLAVQLVEIAVFFPVILFGLSRLGAYALKKVENDESTYFVLMFAILAVAGLLARIINLPDIVGAFLAGLAVNAAVHDKPAKERLEFIGNSLFIPIFFIATGFLIDPTVFFHSIVDNLALTLAVILALVIGKWMAAQIVGRAFAYSPNARKTTWSLTLPQVAATLAATLAAFATYNPAGQRLIDKELLNVVLVLMLTTSILGPVLTERFAHRMLEDEAAGRRSPPQKAA
jgi:Kef-type K+ transport system membrane component KefB